VRPSSTHTLCGPAPPTPCAAQPHPPPVWPSPTHPLCGPAPPTPCVALSYDSVESPEPSKQNYEGTLVASGQGTAEEAQASHEFMVDLFYDHILSGIRLSAP